MLFFALTGEPQPARRPRQSKIDESLLTRIGDDDPAALEELYCLTERAVYSFVLSIVKDPHSAQDIVHDTYIKIRASAHLYRPQGKPLAWIFTIARHLSLNHLRIYGRRAEPEEGLADDPRYSYIDDPLDRLVLRAALEILEEQERQIVLLHAVSGLKHKEIAQNLGIPLSTALSKYHRALKKLKRYLTEQEALA